LEQLSQVANTAQELRAAQDAQSDLLSQLAQASQAARVAQVAQSEQLVRLARRAQSNPLGLEVDDVEEYIRQIARSKE
jgi:hypothetical protein